MNEIVMPRIGVNDDTVTIGQWCVKNGDYVKQKQMIAVLETTKETKELYSRFEGYIEILSNSGNEFPVGTVIAKISDKISSSEKSNENIDAKVDTSNFTEKALKLIKESKIDISYFPKDRIIKEKDVLAVLNSNAEKSNSTPGSSLSNHLYILGTGGFTREIITILNQTYAYHIDGIIGGIGNLQDKDNILGVPIICSVRDIKQLKESGINKIVNAVAVAPNAHSRKDIYTSLKELNYELPNVIHNTAVFGSNVKMGEGNLIFAGAVIGSEVIIGNDCVINVNATISHECKIGDNSHIASGAVLAGNVSVGENSLIGQNVSVYNDVVIGNNVIIQNGATVFKDVPDNSIIKAL